MILGHKDITEVTHEITEPTCALVTLHDGSQNPAVMFQVVLDPAKLSPSGDFLRFNQDNMCELHGWKPIAAIKVWEALETCTPIKDGL